MVAAMLIPVSKADDVSLDLRDATSDHRLGRPLYRGPVARLRPSAPAALRLAARRAALIDAVRPLEAQRMVREAAEDKTVLADPATGGTHPRGIAVDSTLEDRGTGAVLDRGTGFDAFTALPGRGCYAAPAAADVPGGPM